MITRRAVLGAAAAVPFLHMPARAARTPGILRFGLSAYPPTLAPWLNAGVSAGTAQALMNRGLLGYTADGKLAPEMAESWEQDGITGWVFRLREAVWHNGKQVTSDHIKWNFEQIAAEKSTAFYKVQCQDIAAIETPDARTVKLRMKSPNSTLPLILASYQMPMIYPESNAAGSQTIGAGPFILKNFERGVSLDFEANLHFYKPGLPKLKGIKITAYADENLRVAALQAGDVDLIEYVPWQNMDAIEANPRLVLQNTFGSFEYMTFNGKSGPMADKRVRQAIAHAIKRDEVVKAAFFGRGAPLESVPILEGSPFFDRARSKTLAYDPAKAKALLADAGYPNGFSTSLLSTATYGMHKDTAEIVQQNLASVGIQVELLLPEWATRMAQGNRGQYQMSVIGTAAGSNDPDGLANLIDGQLSPSYSRSVNLPTPRTHELLAAGRAEFEPEKRRSIYAEMERNADDEAFFVGIAWRAQGYAFVKDLKGFANMPGALTFFSGYTLETAEFAPTPAGP